VASAVKKRRKNPAPRRAFLNLGLLKSLTILDPASGKTTEMKMVKRWLSWNSAKKNFDICIVKGTMDTKLPSTVEAQHRKFHQADPNADPFVAECPNPVGGLREVGLVKALVYFVPKEINSPGKNEDYWHHAFGDTGHKGGKYPEKVMPVLLKDSRGNLFFKRRKGNIFKIDQWIRG
jgi:hypothetical protein